MQITITGRKIDLTPAIEEYINKKINGLDKFYNQIIRAHVVVGVESKHHLKGQIFLAECKLEIPGNDIFISKTKEDLYAAVDELREQLERELKKHKVKEREKNKREKVLMRNVKEYTLTS